MGRRVVLIAATFVSLVGGVAGGVQAQAPRGEHFVLTGVVSIEGGTGLVWLQEPTHTQNRVVTARVGESIGPYRVTKILEDQVELEGPEGKFSVPLAGGSAPATAARSQEPSQASAPRGPSRTASAAASATEQGSQPALANPNAVVIPRGDPRRNFPASGFPAPTPGSQGAPEQTTAPRLGAGSRDVPVPPSMQTPPPQLPPHSALNNPTAVVIPRGDPRRNFPTEVMLPGNL